MATSVLRTATASFSAANGYSIRVTNFSRVSFTSTRIPVVRCRIYHSTYTNTIWKSSSSRRFLLLAADGEIAEPQIETPDKESDPEPEIEGNTDSALDVVSSSVSDDAVAVVHSSVVLASLSLYKEALAYSDEEKVREVESILKSIEDEKIDLARKLGILSEELSSEKVRIFRISGEFHNFRKRTEREHMSLVTNARGEVLESLLPLMDSFERVKAHIEVRDEGEEQINNSYLSIYKQFLEILESLSVAPVETVGKPFDAMVSSGVGSRFSQAIYGLIEKLNKVYSGFTKTKIRF